MGAHRVGRALGWNASLPSALTSFIKLTATWHYAVELVPLLLDFGTTEMNELLRALAALSLGAALALAVSGKAHAYACWDDPKCWDTTSPKTTT